MQTIDQKAGNDKLLNPRGQWTKWWPLRKAYPRSLSTERMDEIRATLSRRSSPATERVIIDTFCQRRKLCCEPKSVVKPKISRDRARASIPLNQSGEVLRIQDWWDGHHELGWAEHRADSIRRWDQTRKFGQWFSLQQRLWFCSWRWQPQVLEALSALAPAARKAKIFSKNAIQPLSQEEDVFSKLLINQQSHRQTTPSFL